MRNCLDKLYGSINNERDVFAQIYATLTEEIPYHDVHHHLNFILCFHSLVYDWFHTRFTFFRLSILYWSCRIFMSTYCA